MLQQRQYDLLHRGREAIQSRNHPAIGQLPNLPSRQLHLFERVGQFDVVEQAAVGAAETHGWAGGEDFTAANTQWLPTRRVVSDQGGMIAGAVAK